jgi:hypothetical protein
MITNNMRTPANAATNLPLRVLLPICLALAVLSHEAAATPISGTVMGGGGTLEGNTMVSYTPIPVSSPGGADPNDSGMCGVLSLSGTFYDSTVAEIVVRDGYYSVHRRWPASQPDGPTVGWTCVHFSDFTGLPSAPQAEIFLPPTVVSSTGGLLQQKTIGGFPQACIWEGVAGGFSTQGGGFASAAPDRSTGTTTVSAQSVASTTISTYPYCFSFTSPVSWTYLEPNVWILTPPGPPENLSISTKQNWCYMEGIAPLAQDVDAGLSIMSSTYHLSTTNADVMFNCLSLSQ